MNPPVGPASASTTSKRDDDQLTSGRHHQGDPAVWIGERLELLDWTFAVLLLLATHAAAEFVLLALPAALSPSADRAGVIKGVLGRFFVVWLGVFLFLWFRRGALASARQYVHLLWSSLLVATVGITAVGTAQALSAALPFFHSSHASHVAPPVPLRWGSSFLFLLAIFALYRARKKEILGPRTRYVRAGTVQLPADHLVLLLSERTRLAPPKAPGTMDSPMAAHSQVRSVVPHWLEEGRDGPPLFRRDSALEALVHDVTRLDELSNRERAEKEGGRAEQGWNWEMPLRAVLWHRRLDPEKPGWIYLVCSDESLGQAREFSDLLVKRYPLFDEARVLALVVPSSKASRRDGDRQKGKAAESAATAELRPAKDIPLEPLAMMSGLSFEDTNELSRGLTTLLDLIRSGRSSPGSRIVTRPKAEEASIVVDYTGGQKPSSYVAAQITAGREVRAEYVQTKSPKEVLQHDIVTTPPIEVG